MQTEVIRAEQLNVRLSPEEMDRARKLAEHYGVTPANVVRLLLKERARDLGIDVDEAVTHREPKKPSRKR